ncbi:hypothetical protein ABT160_46835 [Streptomyces sp. NPDC001941]|uniref:hypothetical protein n=1 Tax=Streptomyces sp. NPDC001941 TaxID=3154659 RepID=UPI00331B3BF9
MSLVLRRAAAVCVLLIGASLAIWAVAGPGQQWTGSMTSARILLGLGGMGLVGLSAALMFPQRRKKDRDDDRGPLATSSTAAGPLDDLFD